MKCNSHGHFRKPLWCRITLLIIIDNVLAIYIFNIRYCIINIIGHCTKNIYYLIDLQII